MFLLCGAVDAPTTSTEEPGNRMTADRDFVAFYEASRGRLVVQLFAVTGDVQEAEDVVQEAFARAYARWGRVRGYELPEAWVRKVAFNLAMQGLRQARRAVVLRERLDPMREPALATEQVEFVDALGRLPRRHRQVLVLRYLADLTVEQIAHDLGVPAGTVKSRLARARKGLAVQLGEREGARP
jgi:RNA polymerase sigma-70 factor, ECF subfamily